MKTTDKYLVLEKALYKALAKAQQAKQSDDGGTCNFDSPTINYRAMGLQKGKTIETIKKVGLSCFEWKGYDKTNRLVVCGMTAGQGNCRTAMAEAFQKELIRQNVPSGMYYQMD